MNNNTYHPYFRKKPINADYSVLTKKLKHILKVFNSKLKIESELLNTKIFLVQIILKIGQMNYL